MVSLRAHVFKIFYFSACSGELILAVMDPDNDLPLLANTNQVQVMHFRLDLKCDLEASVLKGTCVFFLMPYLWGNQGRIFSIHEMQQKYGTDVPGPTQGTLCNSKLHETNVPEETSGKTKCTTVDCRPIAVPSPLRDRAQLDIMDADTEDTLESGASRISSDRPPKTVHLHWTDTSGNQESPGEHTSGACMGHQDTECDGNHPFSVILDCCDLDIDRVEYADMSDTLSKTLASSYLQPLSHNRPLFSRCLDSAWLPLEFSVGRWSLSMWKPGFFYRAEFPLVVRVTYTTRPTGTSLRWTRDQDDKWGSPPIAITGLLCKILLAILWNVME